MYTKHVRITLQKKKKKKTTRIKAYTVNFCSVVLR